MNKIIETERLLLREFNVMDAAAVYEFNSNKEVHKYTGDEVIQSLNRAKEIITDIWLEDYKKYGYGRWAVVYKPEDKVIGFAGLKYLPEIGETDIGFRILPKYWGKGIISEASKEIIKYGFEKLALEKIIGIALPDNIGSWRILEKTGLQFYQKRAYDEDSKEIYNWYKLEKEAYLKLQ